jgi:hypothetical protein
MPEWKWLPYRMVSGALAGGCFVALTQIITKERICGALYWAVVCFAITIPTMTAYYLYPPTFAHEKGSSWPPTYCLFHLFYLFALVVGFVGVALVFFSAGRWPGVIFVLAFLAGERILRVGSAHKAHVNGFR